MVASFSIFGHLMVSLISFYEVFVHHKTLRKPSKNGGTTLKFLATIKPFKSELCSNKKKVLTKNLKN